MTYATRSDLVARFGNDELDRLGPEPADLGAAATLSGDTVTVPSVAGDSTLWETLEALDSGDLVAVTVDGDEVVREVTKRPEEPDNDPGTWTLRTRAAARRVPAALTDADAEIDVALAASYDLPLAAGTYPALVAIAADLARLRLYDDAVPEDAVLGRANRSRARLRDIVDGRAALVDGDGDVVARRVESAAPLGARVSDATPALTRKALRGY